MVSAIIYTSDTGFTRRYAQMLGEQAGIPVYDLKSRDVPFSGAPVVYLSWLRAGGIRSLGRVMKRWNVRGICAVGLAPDNSMETIAKANRTGSIPLFYLQGGYAPEQLKGLSKIMMSAMTKMLTRKPPKDEYEAEKQKVLLQGGDFVTEEQLLPVLEWLKKERQP